MIVVERLGCLVTHARVNKYSRSAGARPVSAVLAIASRAEYNKKNTQFTLLLLESFIIYIFPL
jgi:hypothetical protein